MMTMLIDDKTKIDAHPNEMAR